MTTQDERIAELEAANPLDAPACRTERPVMTRAKTDRELLELAAKAAGIPLKELDDRYDCWEATPVLIGRAWNPLTDDDDAFRLAATLGLVVDFSRPSAALPFTRHSYDLSDGGGSAEAARRAVVRAAAEIGRAMS